MMDVTFEDKDGDGLNFVVDSGGVSVMNHGEDIDNWYFTDPSDIRRMAELLLSAAEAMEPDNS